MNPFSINLTVRDYELDMQGIVNNSVYQNYLEHARHQYLHHHNIDFAKLTEKGIILVVKKIEMDFKNSLRSNQQFKVEVTTEQEGHLKLNFIQKIIRLSDNKVCLTAKVMGVCLINGKLTKPNTVSELTSIL